MAPEPRPRRSCRHRKYDNPDINIPSGSPAYHDRRSNANVDVNNGQTSVNWNGDQGNGFNLDSGTGGTNFRYSSNGNGYDTDCSDDEDNYSPGRSGSSRNNPYPSSTSTSSTGADSLPNSAQLVKAGGDDKSKLMPIAIIVPVVVGFAILLLGIGFFVMWRKRRAAAREGSAEEGSGENASAGGSSSQMEMRGGEGQMTGTVIGLVGPTKYEIPPTYEASSRDRSVSSSGNVSEVNPFADPVVADGIRRGSGGTDGHNGRGATV
ncbi:hypothetical protein BZA77DRAFT_361604 [Pyronema omphalodes]|nr:hypothetical protein BZA77DRAFT_361604 [Pyronema omphalodes]